MKCQITLHCSKHLFRSYYGSHQLVKHGLEVYHKALNAVSPDNAVRNAIHKDRDWLIVNGRNYKLHNIHILAFGKAVLGMARAVEDTVGDHVVGGVASVPKGLIHTLQQLNKKNCLLTKKSKIEVIEGAEFNFPDRGAFSAAKKINQMACSLQQNDLALVLISGGGSALLPYPQPPITLEEMSTLTQLLSKAGATIQELNTVRKVLEQLKGGGLAEACYPASVLSLILSDVVGDPLGFIASGPTVKNEAKPQDCLQLLAAKGIEKRVPPSVYQVLEELALTDSKQSEYMFDSVQNAIVGSNTVLLRKAQEEFESIGYVTAVLTHVLTGEATDTGCLLAQLATYVCHIYMSSTSDEMLSSASEEMHGNIVRMLLESTLQDVETRSTIEKSLNTIVNTTRAASAQQRPLCILSGGETVVTVQGQGSGGRNRELALSAALTWHNATKQHKKAMCKNHVYLISAATDGQDGPTTGDASGAVVYPQLVAEAQSLGLDAQNYLQDNDSGGFFSQIHDGNNSIHTGLTGTNVMDIQMILVHAKNI